MVASVEPVLSSAVLYRDLNLKPLEHEWDFNPRPCEGIRNVDHSGMTDLVAILES